MPKNSDRNKITDRSELKVHNRNQLGRPKGKLIKPIPRSNDVAVIVPLKLAKRKANLKTRKAVAKGMLRKDI
jgi:hypothetical protein